MNFSITNNYVLRKDYGEYRSYVKTSIRKSAPVHTLAIADSSALYKAVKELTNSEYSDAKDPTESGGPVSDYAKKLKAFVDTYNNTLQSTSKKTDATARRFMKKLKSLTEEHAKELNNYGISVSDNGTLSIDSGLTIKTTKRFETMFGSKSDYMTSLMRIARNISNHIDSRA